MWWKFLKGNSDQSNADAKAQKEAELRTAGRAPLSEIAKQVKHVELVTKKKSSAILSGEYKSRFKGQGMQFSDFRQYQYGDDIRHIDWRTTARHQDAYVKTFEEERELSIVFAVDISQSNSFGSTGRSKREAMAIALACLGFSAIANGDRVGLLLFTDKVERFVPMRKGRKHILRIIDELLTFEGSSKTSSLDPALTFLSSAMKQGGVAVFASDFFADFDRKKLEILSKKHDLICLRAIDERDLELPNVGLIRIEDPETGETALLSTNSSSFREQYAKSQQDHKQRTEQIIRKAGASYVDLATHADPSRVLHQFFQSRKGRGR